MTWTWNGDSLNFEITEDDGKKVKFTIDMPRAVLTYNGNEYNITRNTPVIDRKGLIYKTKDGKCMEVQWRDGAVVLSPCSRH